MVRKKCAICQWDKGYCQRHHIIPLSEGGKDCEENTIILCPNHHSEVHTIGYEVFNSKYNIKGGILDNRKLLQEVTIAWFNLIDEGFTSDNPNIEIFIQQNRKLIEPLVKILVDNNWDKLDMIAYILGITKRRLQTQLPIFELQQKNEKELKKII